ncbi:MAG: DNA/RNA non-specific endonuclease [Gammaproteobacteria bacterium]|nr:DNA/RNA non-specific endonuclease [Gammaproteobacteria bacterium]
MQIKSLQRQCVAALLAALLAACSGGGSAPATVAISSSGGASVNPGSTTVTSPPSTPSTPTPTAGFTALVLKTRPTQFTGTQRCPPFLDYGTPSLSADFLCRTGFAIGHDPRTRTPLWVIERIGLGSLNGGVERTDNFRADPDLLPGRRAELEDYSGSGYDRGHMAPAGNLTWSNQAMVESFYLSNIAPQNPALNRGAWARLEENIRNWVLERNDLIIITGPVFGMQDGVIGRSPVRIPQAFFKVVFDPVRREAVAFVYPNTDPAANDLAAYRVPLEQLELTTGLALLSTRQ